MTKFINDLQDARRFLEGYYLEAGELAGSELDDLENHIMDQLMNARGYDEDLKLLLERFITVPDDLQTAIQYTLDNLHEAEFKALASWIIDNPTRFRRKLTRKDIKAYESGDDEYGDIVNWAERQLEASEDAFEICEESGEVLAEWYEEEVAVLEGLIDAYLMEDEYDITVKIVEVIGLSDDILEDEALQIAKDIWADQYGIKLDDSELKFEEGFVTVTYQSGFNAFAKNEEEAKLHVKEHYYREHGIALSDDEIIFE